MEVCKVLWFAVLELVLTYFTQITTATHDLDSWRLHEKRILDFACGPPQPRSFKLEDIVDKNDLPDAHSEVFPKMTVLHRCDAQSGCCKSAAKACAPQVTEDAALTFRIISRIGRRHAAGGPRERYLHVVATNHTQCSCQQAYDLPK